MIYTLTRNCNRHLINPEQKWLICPCKYIAQYPFRCRTISIENFRIYAMRPLHQPNNFNALHCRLWRKTEARKEWNGSGRRAVGVGGGGFNGLCWEHFLRTKNISNWWRFFSNSSYFKENFSKVLNDSCPLGWKLLKRYIIVILHGGRRLDVPCKTCVSQKLSLEMEIDFF